VEELKKLSYQDRVGLLFEAHSVLKNVLDVYFRRSGMDPGEDLTHIHLQLRVLIEEILAGPEFKELEKSYHRPFKSLYNTGGAASYNWTYERRPKVDRFHARIIEAHARGGNPRCPRIEPYYTLLKGLRAWLGYANRFPWGALKTSLADLRALASAAEAGGKKRATRQSHRRRGKTSKAGGVKRGQHGFKCLDRIDIPGIHPESGLNIVHVNGGEIKISDKLLTLLLRLIIGLKKGKDGWIDRDILSKEKIVPESGHQIYTRLRKRLEPHLTERNGRDLVENDGKGYYRLSTPPELVTYDKNKLLRHPTRDVRAVARRLPRSNKSKK
jgi:hypothetical protein